VSFIHKRITMRCYWVKDNEVPGGKYLVPGCWGSVVGPHCTCGRKGSRRELEDQVERLKERVRSLEKACTNGQSEVKK
jgi:hypothetical protein